MHAVAQFVGQGHDVAGAPLIVQQQIGMGAGHRGMGESARRLAGAHRRVDPGLVEEPLADGRQRRRELGIGGKHELAGVLPGNQPVVVVGQRRVAVPIGQGFDAEPPGLQGIVAVGELGIGILDRAHQRIDHLVLNEIGEVARGNRAGKGAPAVLDLLVLDQRVGDQGEDTDVVAQHMAQGLGGLPPGGGVAVGETVDHLGGGQGLSAKGKPQRRHGFVEQPRPGRPPGHVLLVQQALDLVGELMGPHGAQVAQPGFIAREGRRLQLRVQGRIVEAVQLQGKEQQVTGNRRRAFLHALKETRHLRIAHVAGIDELRVAHDAAEGFLDLLEARDGRPQVFAAQRRQLAGIVLAKGRGPFVAANQILLQAFRILPGVEVAQVPGRKLTQGFVDYGFCVQCATSCSNFE